MAKVTFGPIVSEARNKVGGVVFSRNPHGAFSRAWAIPPYTNTTAQAAMRAALGTLATRWRLTLNDEQRGGWRSLGCRYKHVDVFAQKSNRPGLQAYLRANLALSSVGAATIDDAPRTQRATDPQAITATAAAGLPPSIQVDPLVDPQPSEAIQVWVSPQLGSGRSYFFRKMRLVHSEPAGTAGPWDPSFGWLARFGGLTFPSKLGVGVRYIDTNTGAIGPWRTALINATAGGTDAMLERTVNLTYADILALPTTSFELVPTPGPAYQIFPFQVFIQMHGDGTPYTNVDPSANMWIDENFSDMSPLMANDAVLAPTELSDLLGGSQGIIAIPSRQQLSNIPYCSAYDGRVSTYSGGGYLADAPLTLRFDNQAAGDLTGGPPADFWKVTVYYILLPV